MAELQVNSKAHYNQKISVWKRIRKDFKINRYVYIMAIPMIIYFILFSYIPMYGVTIAFKDFSPRLGILGSE
ncbi:hypothetical protein [Desnuesiella massiliensis]|uniref:hypothetical protein n=1 Tax=Desnuesiella massiliensis TaxID=1650662 RepID=UPI00311A8445